MTTRHSPGRFTGVTITRSELADLRRKAVAHDRYLRAVELIGTGAEHMRVEARAGDRFAEGWLACLMLFAMTMQERPEPAPSDLPF